MVIQIDTREKARAIQKILETFDSRGIKHISSKLYVGDYMNLSNPTVVIDRKQNLGEVTQNVCQDHKRFKAEIERARDAGIQIIFLIEHGKDIKELTDVIKWVNPRLKVSPLAMSGERLFKVLSTMEKTYGVRFLFCTKAQTGKRIIELLEEQNERN